MNSRSALLRIHPRNHHNALSQLPRSVQIQSSIPESVQIQCYRPEFVISGTSILIMLQRRRLLTPTGGSSERLLQRRRLLTPRGSSLRQRTDRTWRVRKNRRGPQRGDETNMFRFGTKACVLFSGCSAWRSKHTSCHPLNGYLVHYY